MGKIVLLVPREEMLRQAHNILQEKTYEIQEMRVITTESAVIEARQSIADGASIIIARGLQASLIKQYTDIPVVEMVLTAQEMALLIRKARQIIKNQNQSSAWWDFPICFAICLILTSCMKLFFERIMYIREKNCLLLWKMQ